MGRQPFSNHNIRRVARANRIRLLQLAVAAFSLQATYNAFAATKTWTDVDGTFWSNTAGWSPSGVPINGDDVTMGGQSSATTNVVANFTSIYSGVGLNSLKINSSGLTGNFTLSQTLSTSAMVATLEIIGDTVGSNIYTQNGGSNTASAGIILGNASGGIGTYNLSGSSAVTVTAGNFLVGNAGVGFVNQSGGTVTVNNTLAISGLNPNTSTYNLSAGTLNLGASSLFNIGASRGSFIQSGGTVNFSGSTGMKLLNGSVAGSTNTYTLSGTSQITNAGFESIGSAGAGSAANFTQNAGNNTFAAGGTLTVGDAGAGIYNLNSGNLTVASTIIGNASAGNFSQTNGTWNGINVDIGVQSGSTGTYALAGGAIQLTGDLTIGEGGAGTVTQTGGTVTTTGLNSRIVVGNGSTGTYNLSNTGQINVNEIDVGAFGAGAFTGTFNQSGTSSVTVSGNLVLGFAAGATANYTLTSGSLNTHFESIGFSGGSTANFTQNGGNNTTIGLTVGVNGGSTASYTLNSGNLTVGTLANPGNLAVGLITSGATFTQNGGNVSIAGTGGSLTIGGNSGSSGTYLLKSGTLTSDSQFIGQLGSGTFTQNGGTNTVTGTGSLNGLFVGYRGPGTYTLAGFGVPASLTTTSEFIGNLSDGTFIQGLNTTHVVSNVLVLGANTGGTGTFNLNGGTLTTPLLQIGLAAPGVFNQAGGTNTIQTTLSVGGASTGSYNLSLGSLITPAASTGFIVTSTGTFTQSGGNFTGYLLNQGSTVYNGGNFAGTLENAPNAIVTLNASLTAGGGVLNRGFINVPLNLTLASGTTGLNILDNEGTLQLSAGSLGGVTQILNNNFITGFGAIAGSGGFLNNGVVTAAGTLVLNNTGTNSNTGTMITPAGSSLQIDVPLANTGTINLTGGTLKGAGTLNNPVGGTLAGFGTLSITTFNNSGGTLFAQGGSLHLTNALSNPGIIEVAAGATLAGAAIANSNSIQGAGTISNVITNTGTIEPIAGTLVLTAPLTNSATGTLTTAFGNKLLLTGGLANNPGLINLAGGTFDNGANPLNNTGSILGFGTFRTGSTGLTNNGSILFAGGSSNISGPVINTATHTLEVRNSPAIFIGPVTNNLNATFKTTSTTATFAGTFTNNGNYVSDPSTNVFQSATTNTGNMTGSIGDVYIFQTSTLNNSGNFINGGSLTSSDNITNSGTFTQTGPQSWSPGTSFTNTAGKTTFGSNAKLYGLSITGGIFDITSTKLIVEDTSTKAATLAALHADVANHSLLTSTVVGDTLVVSDNAIRMANFPTAATTFGGQPIDANSILITAALPGDANLDGVVDIKDLQDLANHWQQSATDWSQADFDGNGVVALQDLQALANHWQNGVGAQGQGSGESFSEALSLVGQFGGSSSSVPEPMSLAILGLGGVVLATRRRHA